MYCEDTDAYTRTQEKDIENQLLMGIRYFDIRTRCKSTHAQKLEG